MERRSARTNPTIPPTTDSEIPAPMTMDYVLPTAPSNANRPSISTNNRFSALDHNDRPPLEDANNPYFMGNGDHPGLTLVSSPLTDTNFQQWRRDFKISIGAKNKFGFLDGTLPQPAPTDPLYNSWLRCNQMEWPGFYILFLLKLKATSSFMIQRLLCGLN